MSDHKNVPIRVYNPRRLSSWTMEAERIPIGRAGDYKPAMVLLPDGEILLVALHMLDKSQKIIKAGTDILAEDNEVHEVTTFFRSKDGGKTWTERDDRDDIIGHEQFPSITSDGTLFMSSHLMPRDTFFPGGTGRHHSYLHRSEDGGRTWERTKVLLEGKLRESASEEAGTETDRNVVELPDGTLLFGVSLGSGFPWFVDPRRSNVAYMWRSEDRGKTWDTSLRCEIHGYYDNADGFFSNSTTYFKGPGKLIHFVRVGHPSPMTKICDERQGVGAGNDQLDKTMITTSCDGGITWSKVEDFSDYGQMYPRILRLRDGRWLLTFTQRGVFYPLGLRAVISYDEGETWDFHYDHIIIDGFTPWESWSGGGFGNTVQLADGTLVSCYSYRTGETTILGAREGTQTYVELVRWRI